MLAKAKFDGSLPSTGSSMFERRTPQLLQMEGAGRESISSVLACRADPTDILLGRFVSVNRIMFCVGERGFGMLGFRLPMPIHTYREFYRSADSKSYL